MEPINIQVFVDVIALLSGSPVEKSVFLFDDSTGDSTGKGTAGLSSQIWPGQFIRWTVAPIDVQTQVWIDQIEFGPAVKAGAATEPDGQEAVREAEPTGPDDTPSNAAQPDPASPSKTPIWGRRFEGFAPMTLIADTPHHYALHLGFGQGVGVRYRIDGPSLVFNTAISPDLSTQTL